MIEFINKVTGTRMWVADNRIDEYMKRGHTMAIFNQVEMSATKPAEKPAKKPAKKSVKK